MRSRANRLEYWSLKSDPRRDQSFSCKDQLEITRAK